MRAPSSLSRLVALRRLQQERVEAELRAGRHQRQMVLTAAEHCRLDSKETARALVIALEAGQSEYQIAAGIGLKLSPWRARWIEQQLSEAETVVNDATHRWHAARVERLQVESVLAEERRRAREAAEAKEQKSMDGWFLARRAKPDALRNDARNEGEDESSQRLPGRVGPADGTALAKSKV